MVISRETHQIEHGHAETRKRTRQAQVDPALAQLAWEQARTLHGRISIVVGVVGRTALALMTGMTGMGNKPRKSH